MGLAEVALTRGIVGGVAVRAARMQEDAARLREEGSGAGVAIGDRSEGFGGAQLLGSGTLRRWNNRGRGAARDYEEENGGSGDHGLAATVSDLEARDKGISS